MSDTTDHGLGASCASCGHPDLLHVPQDGDCIAPFCGCHGFTRTSPPAEPSAAREKAAALVRKLTAHDARPTPERTP